MNNKETPVVIRSEEDAWELLDLWLTGEDIGEVEFDGWPKLTITLQGGDYKSSLNSGQMAALLEFKSTIGRTYSAISHGAYDMRRLREDEEEQLQFSTEVKKGSSIMETDLTPLVQALSSVVTAYPGSSLIAGVIIGLALVARPLVLKHYETRAKQLEIEERQRLLSFSLTPTENSRHKTFERVIGRLEKHHPQIAQAIPDARQAFWRLASASVNADYMTIAGIRFSQEELQVLSERRARRASDVKEVTRDFRIAGVKKVGSGYRIQLEAKDLVLSVSYKRPQFSDTGLKRLMSYMTSETRISATLEVKTIDKSQLTGRLLRFTPVEAD